MAVNSVRTEIIQFTGDISTSLSFASAPNVNSPGMVDVFSLGVGDNLIAPPSNAVAATIIPPNGNVNIIKLKGQAADTGIPVSKVNPMTIAFDNPATANFILNCTVITPGVRIIWS